MAKNKYTVTFPEKIDKVLTDLSDKEEVSKPEIMRRAISLYYYLHRETEENEHKIAILDDDREIIKEVVFK